MLRQGTLSVTAKRSFAAPATPEEKRCPVALAVSGGSDSMAMLHLALEQVPRELIRVLTVDHGLRVESRSEAEQVGRWCAELGVEHHILTWEDEKPRTGLQAKARKVRYDLMTAWCRHHDVQVLATGHTLDDQAETVAMRKLRTRSARSLAGIWPEMAWGGVKVVRPLLAMRRDGLRDLLRARGLEWIDDPSNDNPKFERVRVRGVMTGAEELAAEADRSREEVVLLDEAVDAFMADCVKVDEFGLVRIALKGASSVTAKRSFAVTDEAPLVDVLARCIRMAGGGRPEPSSVARLLGEGQRATLGGAVVVFRNAEILVGREPGRVPSVPVVIPASGEIIWDGRFVVMGPPGALVRPLGVHCPRPAKSIPAFVLAGLPQVEWRVGLVTPHFDSHPHIQVKLGERFRL